MMGRGKKTVILLTSSRLKAVSAAVVKEKIQVYNELTVEYESHDFAQLTEALAKVKSELKTSQVRVILPEEKTYLKLIEFSLAKTLSRELVQAEAQSSIPETLKEGYFDWRHVGNTGTTKQVQVLAVSNVYLTFLRRAAQEAKLEIESFEPVSLALARLWASVKKPVLVVFKTDEYVVAACYRGLVLESSTVGEEELENRIERVKKHVQENFKLEIGEIIRENLDPIHGTMIKEDLRGKDAQVLNLPGKNMAEEKEVENITENSPQRQEEVQVTEVTKMEPEVKLRSLEQAPTGSGKKIIFYVVGAVVLLGLIGGGVWWFLKGRKVDSETLPTPTPLVIPTLAPTEAPSPTPEAELTREDLTIEILNGGGVSGAAGAAQEYLSGLGYEVAKTGNATSFDYELTEIQIKESKQSYLRLLTSDLEEKYELTDEVGAVEEESDYDAIVIIGKK